MTSNIGSQYFLDENVGDIRSKIEGHLGEYFRPEFINRIDEVLLFNKLDRSSLRKIVDIQLDKVASRLEQRNRKLKVEDDAKDFLMEKGYNPAFGARPLKRAIQNEIENKIAQLVLEGKFAEGATLTVAREGEGLKFQC